MVAEPASPDLVGCSAARAQMPRPATPPTLARNSGRGTLGVPKGVAMPTIPSRDRSEIIDEIRRYAHDRLTPEQERLFQTFVGQYYRHVARDDLAARRVHDLYAAAMFHL